MERTSASYGLDDLKVQPFLVSEEYNPWAERLEAGLRLRTDFPVERNLDYTSAKDPIQGSKFSFFPSSVKNVESRLF